MGIQCCSRPHGNDGLFAPLLSLIAFVLASSGTNWCDFLQRNVEGNDNLSTGIGMWSYQGTGINEGYCVWYPSTFEPDTYFEVSRASAGMGQCLGGIAMIILAFSSCVPLSKPVWMASGFLLLLACMFQGLTFMMLKSTVCETTFDGTRDAACELMRGSKCVIAAVVFWFLSSVSVLRYNPPEAHLAPSRAVKQTVTTTEEVKEDGTKVVTTKTEYTNV